MVQWLELFFAFNKCMVRISFSLLVRRGFILLISQLQGYLGFLLLLRLLSFLGFWDFSNQQLILACILMFSPINEEEINIWLIQYVKLIDQHLCYILITLLAMQHFFLVHLFLRLYRCNKNTNANQLTIIMKYISNQTTITPKVQMILQKTIIH